MSKLTERIKKIEQIIITRVQEARGYNKCIIDAEVWDVMTPEQQQEYIAGLPPVRPARPDHPAGPRLLIWDIPTPAIPEARNLPAGPAAPPGVPEWVKTPPPGAASG